MKNQQIVVKCKNKVEECILGVQQEMELSFSRIDAFLDQLPLVSYQPVPHKSVNDAPKLTQISFSLIQNYTNQLNQQVEPILKSIIHQQFQNLAQVQQSDKYTKDNNQQLHPIQQHNQHQSNSNPFTYNLIQNHSIKQEEDCRAIAINNDNSIVLVTCKNEIKVLEFKQEQLKLIQLLSEHKYQVYTLNFMKKSTQFISGSGDKQIIIWCMDQHNQWICQYKLNQHQDIINCLILNNNEDLIISGSNDKTIKFWKKQNQWICSQTNTDQTNYVTGLSLNEKQDKLISCGYNMFILIIEESQQDQKWNVIQKITVEQYGFRLSFINDNVFTFQPILKEYMHVYEINSTNKQYSKTNQIDVKSDSNGCDYFFPQQYIKSKCLLVNKNGKNVNLIRKNQNGHFITQQSLQFGHNQLYGSMSENGQYLMTWDQNSKEIQIRKYQQL